jgi:hypothetical protein
LLPSLTQSAHVIRYAHKSILSKGFQRKIDHYISYSSKVMKNKLFFNKNEMGIQKTLPKANHNCGILMPALKD